MSENARLQDDPRHGELIGWLREQNHSDEEIELIMLKVAEYDKQTTRESVFDSIDAGHFDLGKIIGEALEEPGDGQ